jgi:hypothetical protein
MDYFHPCLQNKYHAVVTSIQSMDGNSPSGFGHSLEVESRYFEFKVISSDISKYTLGSFVEAFRLQMFFDGRNAGWNTDCYSRQWMQSGNYTQILLKIRILIQNGHHFSN